MRKRENKDNIRILGEQRGWPKRSVNDDSWTYRQLGREGMNEGLFLYLNRIDNGY